jgi:hypothetical protein
MIRYTLAAVALKAFSLNEATRAAYRRVGNTLGGRRRGVGIDLDAYVSRGDLLVNLAGKYLPPEQNQQLLELGTGWMHWFALYLRLFRKAEIATLDVWDNRQFEALKSGFARLEPILMGRGAAANLRSNLHLLLEASSFEDLYQRLQLSYVIQPDGSLAEFATASRACVFSFHVLEHVPRSNVDRLCAEIFRVLAPGGISIHQIGIDDHLTHYDPSCSPKQYLSYSDRKWKLLFENSVQYFNRLQRRDWLHAFAAPGFVLRETLSESADLGSLRIDPLYRDYNKDDLACTILTLVHQKPGSDSAVCSEEGARPACSD